MLIIDLGHFVLVHKWAIFSLKFFFNKAYLNTGFFVQYRLSTEPMKNEYRTYTRPFLNQGLNNGKKYGIKVLKYYFQSHHLNNGFI